MTDTDLRSLKKLLERHEENRKFPYVDTVGKITIGVGHNLTDLGLTPTQISGILDDDIQNTLAFLDKNCPWFKDLDAVRQKAIADMTFNLMGKILDFSKMIDALKKKDWDRVSAELLDSVFAQQTGKRAKNLAYMLRTGLDIL